MDRPIPKSNKSLTCLPLKANKMYFWRDPKIYYKNKEIKWANISWQFAFRKESENIKIYVFDNGFIQFQTKIIQITKEDWRQLLWWEISVSWESISAWQKSKLCLHPISRLTVQNDACMHWNLRAKRSVDLFSASPSSPSPWIGGEKTQKLCNKEKENK